MNKPTTSEGKKPSTELMELVDDYGSLCASADCSLSGENIMQEMKEAKAKIQKIADSLDQLESLREKYNELLYAVGNKYPNESRHQTALRYIKQAETSSGEGGECCKEDK